MYSLTLTLQHWDSSTAFSVLILPLGAGSLRVHQPRAPLYEPRTASTFQAHSAPFVEPLVSTSPQATFQVRLLDLRPSKWWLDFFALWPYLRSSCRWTCNVYEAMKVHPLVPQFHRLSSKWPFQVQVLLIPILQTRCLWNPYTCCTSCLTLWTTRWSCLPNALCACLHCESPRSSLQGTARFISQAFWSTILPFLAPSGIHRSFVDSGQVLPSAFLNLWATAQFSACRSVCSSGFGSRFVPRC